MFVHYVFLQVFDGPISKDREAITDEVRPGLVYLVPKLTVFEK